MKELLQPVALSGGKKLPSRILPGPMEGIMIPKYCQAIMEFDLLPLWITPFIRITHNTPRPKKLLARLEPFRPLPIVAQIMGTYTEYLAKTAGILNGFDGVLGVELNCACSSKTVIGSGSGSALLQNPEWIRDTVIEMREHCPSGGIGVKIRSGFESPGELPSILKIIRDASPDWIVMHYRTRKEAYRSVSNGYERFKIARDLLPSTILFASGDIFSAEEALKLVSDTAVDGITPARGLMRNPWLIRDIECLCRGETPAPRNITIFLMRLLEILAEDPRGRTGLILEIAQNKWGKDSDFFKSLTQDTRPAAIRERLKTINSHR